MDILTHTLSGAAAGSVLSHYAPKGFLKHICILTLSGAGGFLPDIDAVSLWSKFDATLGTLFSLQHSGRSIYFSRFWYSHHGFFHSIAAGLAASAGIALFIYLLMLLLCRKQERRMFSETAVLCLSGFFLGFCAHLCGDLCTPGCVWGGIHLLWPLPYYTGGTGEIWWW
ncbi:MAG: metal-dependent hydrolase, partial [Spirochaetota bacterium]